MELIVRSLSKASREEVCGEQTAKKEPNSLNEEKIEQLLFSQVERPSKTTHVRIVNVFEDRYRINVWVVVVENGVEKEKIGASYFAHYDGNELRIRS